MCLSEIDPFAYVPWYTSNLTKFNQNKTVKLCFNILTMACNFTINFAQPASVMIQTLKSKVIAQGGTVDGNEVAGAIRVPLLGSHISGSYTINGQQVNIVIDHKPFLVSCKQIESFLAGNL